ncbi:hypothetical protein D3C76_1791420 [compost metagenome]
MRWFDDFVLGITVVGAQDEKAFVPEIARHFYARLVRCRDTAEHPCGSLEVSGDHVAQ